MIVDTSALIAVIRSEPEGKGFVDLMARSRSVRMSAATYLETGVVIDGARQPVYSRRLDDLIHKLRVVIEPVTPEQAKVAREAYRDFGRGSGHPAKLNFGDCFSYALARVTDEPLLFKGNDFVHTDLRPAVQPGD